MTSTDLLNGLKVNVKPSSSVLDVTYDSHHKAKALAVLQGISVVFGDLVRRDLGVTNNLHRPGPLLVVANVFDPPHLEPTPVSPKPKKDAVYAAVLGLGIGVVLAFFAESIDDRIRSRREAEEAFGAPVVAAIPRRLFARPGREPDALELTMTDPMRLLRANIQIARPESNDPLSVLVTSVQSDSTTTAMIAKNLGASLALAGERVVYVDAGMHPKKSGKASSEQADNRPGLADVLTGEASIEDVVQEVHLPGYATNSASGNGASSNGNSADLHGQLFMIPAGTTKMDSPAVDSAKLDSLLGRLWKIATYVIIDAPPVTGADAVPLVASADNVLIVAKVGETTRARANTVREILARLGSRHVGVVLAVPSIRSAPRLN
jgi:Mrp family chromosome partitioning ATPase